MATTQSAKGKVHHRTMSEYGCYNFVDKDPVIDVLRSMIDLEAKVRGVTFWAQIKDVSVSTGIHASTLNGWFNGPTISPRFAFCQRVAIALGYEFEPTASQAAAKRRRANH